MANLSSSFANISTLLNGYKYSNETDYSIESVIDNNTMHIVVPIVFIWIMVIGVAGNGSLVYIIIREKALRTVPNALIVNLSIGDLLLLLFSAPFFTFVFGADKYPFNEPICKMNAYLQTLSLGVSIFTLTALSWDRYIAIVHPMNKHKGKPMLKVVVIVTVIWVTSALLAVFDAWSYTLIEGPGIAVCFEVPPKLFGVTYAKARSIVHFLLLFVIPLVIIGCFYMMMAKILVKSSREMPCELTVGTSSNRQQQRQIKDRIKVAKFVLSLVIMFVVCWLPRHIFVFWFAWDINGLTDFWMIFKILSICLMYAYSCVNPYALFCLSRQFRKYYVFYLFRCCRKYRYRTDDLRRGSTSMTMIKSHSDL